MGILSRLLPLQFEPAPAEDSLGNDPRLHNGAGNEAQLAQGVQCVWTAALHAKGHPHHDLAAAVHRAPQPLPALLHDQVSSDTLSSSHAIIALHT